MTALLKVEKELVSNVTRPCTPLHQPIEKLPRLVLAADCRCWLGTATKFCRLIGLKDQSAGLLDQAALPEWSADDTLQHGRRLQDCQAGSEPPAGRSGVSVPGTAAS